MKKPKKRYQRTRAGQHDKGKGGKRPHGHLGPGMHARGAPTGKRKGHGGGKSVAKPGGKVGTYPSGHEATQGRAVKPMGKTQGSPKRAGTDLGGNRKAAVEKRLQDQYL